MPSNSRRVTDERLKQARAALRWALHHGVTISHGEYYTTTGRIAIPQEFASELKRARQTLQRRAK